mgnify:CR=1 FL=1
MNDLVTLLIDVGLLFFLIGIAIVVVNYVGGKLND